MAAVQVNDGGVNVPQVDHLRLLVAVLVQNSVSTNEEENADAHDEGPQDLQPVGVEIPAERGGGASETPPNILRFPPQIKDLISRKTSKSDSLI